MKFFLSYIKHRLPVLVILAVCTVVFTAAFALYGVPVGAALYPAMICLVLLILTGAVDCILANKKHKAILALIGQTEELTGKLSEMHGLYDGDYILLADGLCRRIAALKTEAMSREADITDYYTKWVHQIKLPIAAMKLTLEGEDSRLSRSISDDLFRIEQYVGMVLTYLRLGSESTDYLFREYELDSIVKAEIKKFAGQFIRRGIKLVFTPSGKRVTTDEKWLGFAVGQIISNSLKYTREGSISIYCEEPLTLVISDTGIGIAPEDLPRVFERGYTGSNGRTETASSGIGLWLCRKICDELNCTISIESEPGKGTTVRLGLYKPPERFE